MRNHSLKTRLGAQGGFALPAAIIVLFIITILTAAAVTVSVGTSTSTTRDNNVKSALAAAEAGLHAATFRLNMLKPEEKFCVTNKSVATPEANGYCKDTEAAEALGNNASFTYWTSEELASGGECVGQRITSQETIAQRCVIAEGEVNGVKRRVAQRVASFKATPTFPISGITALKELKIENNSHIKGSVGSNGKITIKNNAEVTEACTLGPSGEVTPESACKGSVFKHSTAEGPLTLGPVQPGNSATENQNYYITNYLNYVEKKEKKPVEPYDEAEGVTFNAATRQLSMSNKAKLILREGTYNFCSFETQNNATIELAANAKVVIFIDSANDPNSKCPSSGSGVFKVWNNSTIINPSRNPLALQIYVYDGSGGTVYIKNNAELFASIYAPLSKVNIENNGLFNGAISGNEVELGNNFEFKWYEEDGKVKTGTIGIYYRSAWAECPPTHTGSSPIEGC